MAQLWSSVDEGEGVSNDVMLRDCLWNDAVWKKGPCFSPLFILVTLTLVTLTLVTLATLTLNLHTVLQASLMACQAPTSHLQACPAGHGNLGMLPVKHAPDAARKAPVRHAPGAAC
eukprot:404078-Pelagomonas_calceolata.AAC.2